MSRFGAPFHWLLLYECADVEERRPTPTVPDPVVRTIVVRQEAYAEFYILHSSIDDILVLNIVFTPESTEQITALNNFLWSAEIQNLSLIKNEDLVILDSRLQSMQDRDNSLLFQHLDCEVVDFALCGFIDTVEHQYILLATSL